MFPFYPVGICLLKINKRNTKMWNMFKVNDKDTRTTPMPSFWCLYRSLWIYFTPCSSVSIFNFEQVIVDWVYSQKTPQNQSYKMEILARNESKNHCWHQQKCWHMLIYLGSQGLGYPYNWQVSSLHLLQNP